MRPAFALLVSCLLLAAAPSAHAAALLVTPASTEVTTSNSTVVVPVQVQLQLDSRECAAGTSQDISVTLTAVASGASVAGTAPTVAVEPAGVTFQVGAGDTLQGPYTTPPQTVVLTVSLQGNTADVTFPATIEASTQGASCTLPTQEVSAASGNATTQVTFEAQSRATEQAPAEEPVPGLELPLLAAAVLGAALLVRRRK
jgi:MYXO-CTERM domain-containing protein